MKKEYPFAAVVFDMDGTIVDNEVLHKQVWREFACIYGLNPSEAAIKFTVGYPAVEVIISLFGKSLSSQEVFRLASERGKLYRQRLVSSDAIQTTPGVKAFLKGLGELEVCRILATGASLLNVEAVFKKFNLAPYFDAIVTSEDVHNGKPKPEIFLTAARRAGVNPEKCLVIEDSTIGIHAAQAAGAACLGIATSQSEQDLRREGANWTATNFLNLPKPIALPIPLRK